MSKCIAVECWAVCQIAQVSSGQWLNQLSNSKRSEIQRAPTTTEGHMLKKRAPRHTLLPHIIARMIHNSTSTSDIPFCLLMCGEILGFRALPRRHLLEELLDLEGRKRWALGMLYSSRSLSWEKTGAGTEPGHIRHISLSNPNGMESESTS